MHGIKSTIAAIAVHPHKPLLAIAGAEGFVILWDYTKRDKFEGLYFEDYSKESREKKADGRKVEYKYTCMEFTPNGEELLVAKGDGTILIFNPITCE
jgi:WD40 repeat protein